MVLAGPCCVRCFCLYLRPCRCRQYYVTIFVVLIVILAFSLLAYTGLYPGMHLTLQPIEPASPGVVLKKNVTLSTADIQKRLTAQSNAFMVRTCGNNNSNSFDIVPSVLSHNRERLRRQLSAWRRVVLMITYLNPTFSSLETLHFLYGRFFGQVAYCVSALHMAQWKNSTRTFKKQHWLLVYDGYAKSKDDRSYECWEKLQNQLGTERRRWRRHGDTGNGNNHNLVGVLSIMDDVLFNLWNFAVVHRGGGISSLLSKIWSMTNGGLFIPKLDVHAVPFFIGNLQPLIKGFDTIGETDSFRSNSRLLNTMQRLANATICSRPHPQQSPSASTCSATKHVWSHYARFFDEAAAALTDLQQASITRNASVLESTAIFADCWHLLHSWALFALGNVSLITAPLDDAATIVGEIPADVLYLPIGRLHELVRLLSIFRRHSLHAEIAVPTAVTCLINKLPPNSNNLRNDKKTMNLPPFLPLSDAGMLWNETTRLRPWEFYVPSQPLPFIHPVKFSQITKDGTFRAFLCQRVFPNFIV